MTEILTESFCERCGTRYTFETVAPRQKRLGGLKVIGRGLKTFVMSDDSSLDEALAAARSDEEREITSHQLDAFHKTFNFCMNCRQYTCGNCWNPIEARCLSCAPRADQMIGEAPLQLMTLAAPAGSPLDVGVAEGAEGPLPADWQASDDLLHGPGMTEAAADGNGVEPDAASLFAARAAELEAGGVESLAPPSEVTEEAGPAATPGPAVDAELAAFATADAPRGVEATAASAARETTAMLGRFRPGENLDAEIEAYEASLESEEAAEPASEQVIAAEPEPIVAAEPEPIVAAEPEPEPVMAAEPASEPVMAAEPPDAAPAAPQRDIVEQPSWPRPEVPAAAPGAEPQWPTGPRWPTAIPAREVPTVPSPAPPPAAINPAAADPLAFLALRAGEAMWAASAQDVVAPVAAGAVPAATVHSCVSCGLSLSATARFCRRCGTRQSEA